MKCPECEKEFEVGMFEDIECPYCGCRKINLGWEDDYIEDDDLN